MSDRTYAPDVESTDFARAGLPDDPNLEMRTAADHDDDDPKPPCVPALFPEVITWTDDQLVIAIELADRREPALNLYANGDLPDRHEAFLDACSAELVARLGERSVVHRGWCGKRVCIWEKPSLILQFRYAAVRRPIWCDSSTIQKLEHITSSKLNERFP